MKTVEERLTRIEGIVAASVDTPATPIPWQQWYLGLREAIGGPVWPEPHARAIRHARDLVHDQGIVDRCVDERRDAESLLALALRVGLEECERLRQEVALQAADITRLCHFVADGASFTVAPNSPSPRVEVPVVSVEAGNRSGTMPNGFIVLVGKKRVGWWDKREGIYGADAAASEIQSALTALWPAQVAAGGSWEGAIAHADERVRLTTAEHQRVHARYVNGGSQPGRACGDIEYGRVQEANSFAAWLRAHAPSTLSAPGAGGVKDEPIQHDTLYTTIAKLRADLASRDAEIGRLQRAQDALSADLYAERARLQPEIEAAVAEERDRARRLGAEVGRLDTKRLQDDATIASMRPVVDAACAWAVAKGSKRMFETDSVLANIVIAYERDQRTAGGGGERGTKPENTACERCAGTFKVTTANLSTGVEVIRPCPCLGVGAEPVAAPTEAGAGEVVERREEYIRGLLDAADECRAHAASCAVDEKAFPLIASRGDAYRSMQEHLEALAAKGGGA